MQIISTISLAGGQGKTTTCYFLAKMLALKGYKVLAIDCDPQANLTFFLNCQIKSTQPTLLELLKGEVKPEETIYETIQENLFIIPADRALTNAGEYLSGSGAGAFILRRRLNEIRDLFDFAIVDVQPTRSQICITASGAANLVLIPVESATKGLNSLLDTLDFLKGQTSIGAFTGKILGAIPFRDRWVGRTQTHESRESIEAMSELGGSIVMLPSIKESEKFKQATRKGLLLADLGDLDLAYPFEKTIKLIEEGFEHGK